MSALLEAGVDVNALHERKRTPLHAASRKGHVSTTLSPLLLHPVSSPPGRTKVRAPASPRPERAWDTSLTARLKADFVCVCSSTGTIHTPYMYYACPPELHNSA